MSKTAPGTMRKILSVLLALSILLSGLIAGSPGFTAAASDKSKKLQNVALNKTVTGTRGNPESTITAVTDGRYGCVNEFDYYEIGGGIAQDPKDPYYAQVDLGEVYPVERVNLWRYYKDNRKYWDTIVFVSEDEDFTADDIVYNSDKENFFGFGAGADEPYAETADGKEIAFEPRDARYIRIINNGHDRSWQHGGHFVEIEAWADVSASEAPETQIMDNADIHFEGKWTTYNDSKAHGGTACFSNDPDAYAEFEFEGSSFSWYGQKDINFNYGNIYVDGRHVGIGDGSTTGANPYQVSYAEVKGLENKKHTVRIYPVGPAEVHPNGSGYNLIDVDFIGYSSEAQEVLPDNIYAAEEELKLKTGNSHNMSFFPANGEAFAAGYKCDFEIKDPEIASVSSEDGTACEIIGKAVGETILIVSVAGTDVKKEIPVRIKSDQLPEKKMKISNEEPLLIVPVYGQVYHEGESELAWNDTLLGRWNQIPEDIRSNVVMEIHLGGFIGLGTNGNSSDREDAKRFYEQQLDIAAENNIPVMIVTATAGLVPQYTATNSLDNEWLENTMDKYDCLKGFIVTENYWTDYNTVATRTADYMRIAAENGGYVIWSEHKTQVVENVLRNTAFSKALEEHGDSFIFNWKNTPVTQNAGTASYMQGLWLAGVIDQWGGLADTWKWWEKGFWKLFDETRAPYAGTRAEECRAVVSEPEALLGIEMLTIYNNGGSVYNFEHPAYVFGSNDVNSPAFENVVAETFRYIMDNPAPSREEILAETKAIVHGNISQFHVGLNTGDESLPTYTTGRYGLIPAIPSSISLDKVAETAGGKDKFVGLNDARLATEAGRKEFFDALYPENYTGSAFAQKVGDKWVIYNSHVNVNENQYADIQLEDKKVHVDVTPHTFVIMSQDNNGISVHMNNYRVNKDSIWEGYSSSSTKWNTDINDLMQKWVTEEYSVNPDDGEFRETVFCIQGMTQKPLISVDRAMEDSYEELKIDYNEAADETVITVKSNGYMNINVRVTDKSGLQAAYDKYSKYEKDGYTEESWKNLAASLEAAKEVLDNPEADQQSTDAALKDLEEKAAGLEKVTAPEVDKSGLQAAYDKYSSYEKKKYTSESWKNLAASLEAAKEVLDNPEADQQSTDAALKDLEEKAGRLEKVTALVDDKPGKKPVPDAGKQVLKGNTPQTGDTSGIFVVMFIMISAASLAVLTVVRKSKSKRH